MKQVFTIFKHYLYRQCKDPMTVLVFTVLPITMTFVTLMINPDDMPETIRMGLILFFLIVFTFFTASQVAYYLNQDFHEGALRWRLAAAPVPRKAYFIGLAMSTYTLSVLSSVIYVGASILLFNAHYTNFLVLVPVMLLLIFIVQCFSTIIYFISKTRTMGEGIAIGVGMVFMFAAGLMFELPSSAFTDLLLQYGTPVNIAFNALFHSNFTVYEILATEGIQFAPRIFGVGLDGSLTQSLIALSAWAVGSFIIAVVVSKISKKEVIQ